MGVTQASAEAGCVQAAAAPVVCERFDDLGADGSPVRLGIMGGTFDPIHIGHLACAEQAREAFDLDAVVFIPAGKPAFKLKRDVTPAEQRFEMCRLAATPLSMSAASRSIARASPTRLIRCASFVNIIRETWRCSLSRARMRYAPS